MGRPRLLGLVALALLTAPATASAWTAPRELAAGDPQGVGVDRAGGVTVLWREPFTDSRFFSGASVAYGRPGRLRVQRLTSGAFVSQLAVADSGHAAAAWIAPDDNCAIPAFCPGDLRVATKRPDGRFGRPVTVARDVFGRISVRVGERGEVLVAALRGVRRPPAGAYGRVVVASRRSAAAAWRTQIVGDAAYAGGGAPGLAMTRDGSAVVAWGYHNASPQSRGLTYGATRRAHRRFGPARILHRESALEIGAVVEPAGGALVVFQAGGPFASRIHAARHVPGGGWRRPQVVGEGGQPTLASDATGRAVLLWTRAHSASFGSPPDVESFVARRTPGGGAFSGPASILPRRAYGTVGLAPGRRPLVAWTLSTGQSTSELRVSELVGSRLADGGRLLSRNAGGPHVAVNRAGARAVAWAEFPENDPQRPRVRISTHAP